MSVPIAIGVIAVALFAGTVEGKRRQARQIERGAVAPDDIDGCPTVYADEEGCECLIEHLLDVDYNERGNPICNNCGRRRV